MDTTEHLQRKRPVILITNACTLKCGGCLQLCGHYTDPYFISMKQLHKSVQSCIAWANDTWRQLKIPWYLRFFGLYGGEPTIHPQWAQIVRILERDYANYPFVVYTNGHWLGNDLSITYMSPKLNLEYLLYPIQIEVPDNFWNDLMVRHNHYCIDCQGTLKFLGFDTSMELGQFLGYDGVKLVYECEACKLRYLVECEKIGGKFNRSDSTIAEIDKLIAKFPKRRPSRFAALFSSAATFYSGNIGYRIDYKDKWSVRYYSTPLVAAQDFVKSDDYFRIAQEKCFLWKTCESLLLDGKAYFCLTAGAMDKLFYNGQYGWALTDKNPFNVSANALQDQASHFCHRCGYCLGNRLEIDKIIQCKQLSCAKTLISTTNFQDLQKKDNVQLI